MIPGIQKQSQKVKAIIDSSSEARIGWAKVAILLVAVSVALTAANNIWNRQAGDPVLGISAARGQSVEVLPTDTPQALPTSTSTLEAAAATHVEQIIHEVIVTATPTPLPQIVTEYRDVYYEVTVEVTRIVEVAAIPLPTNTPVPLAPGNLEICVRVEGARELYIGGYGVVSGGCSTFSFGVGQTAIQVQVNK